MMLDRLSQARDTARRIAGRVGNSLTRRTNRALVRLLRRVPPREIPPEMAAAYTMGGEVELRDWYLDDYYLPLFPRVFGHEQIEAHVRVVRDGQCGGYGETDRYLYEALTTHPIRGKTVVILGSVEPFYEAVALCYGAARVTTVEYNRVRSLHPMVETLTVDEYRRRPVLFDVGIAISSFEHDGLGRYGDPLNPDGDLTAMANTRRMLRPGGLLFLSVPVGRDTVFFNAHRVYGAKRLPRLLDGWQEIGRFGFTPGNLDARPVIGPPHEPVFVLRAP